MVTRTTTVKPQTLKQAKAEYKKHGPRISSQEQRQIERGAELWRRAEKIKETERRKRRTAEKKKMREDRTREERKRLNIKSPEPRLSPRQTRVVNFFKCEKKDATKATTKDAPDQSINHDSDTEVDTEVDTDEEEDKNTTRKEQDSTNCHMQLQQSFENFSFDEDLMAALDDQIATQSNNSESVVANPVTVDRPRILKDLDDLDPDFLASGSQIQREISTPSSSPQNEITKVQTISRQTASPFQKSLPEDIDLTSLLSTQDVTFSIDDLEELGLENQPLSPICPKEVVWKASMNLSPASPKASNEPPVAILASDRMLMPPPPVPMRIQLSNKPMPSQVDSRHDPWEYELSTQDFAAVSERT
ncbi:hypothetical protein FH972_024341 [Carpinus fangiana]|uniref:Uncharacterized protein n=1 Tax=Carpinus fangiana TaxID=176857 RepID=A0A5N6KYH8_9ROSI|nr:hypothetical protein FH972_024341 [Carpinus fangiana]